MSKRGVAIASACAFVGYVFGHSVVPVPMPACPRCPEAPPTAMACPVVPVRRSCPETVTHPQGRWLETEGRSPEATIARARQWQREDRLRERERDQRMRDAAKPPKRR